MKKNKRGSLAKTFKQYLWSLQLFKEYYVNIIAYSILVLIKMLVDLGLTYAVGIAVDYIVDDDMHTLVRFALIFIAVFLLRLVITYITTRLNAYNYSEMRKKLTLMLYDKTLNADWESLEEHHSGDLLTRISQDAKTISGNVVGLFPTLISVSCSVLAAIVVVISFDYTILIVFILIIPLVYISTKLFSGRIMDAQRESRKAESDIMLLSKETFHNMQAVKAFGLFDVFHVKMEKRTEWLKQCDLRSNLMYMVSWVVTQGLGLLAVVISGAWMIYRVHQNYITVGNIASMGALTVSAGTALTNVMNLMPTIIEFLASSERVKEMLEVKDEPDHCPTNETGKLIYENVKQNMTISIKDLWFHYHTGPNIFESADMYAKSGEIVALVGPSGEGKTTMMRILLGIVRAQEGVAELVWENGKKLNMGPLTRSLISYVPQGNTMMSGTIADNMRIIKPDATDEEIIDALKISCAYDFVKKLPKGINHEVGEGGLGFSEGQSQRLAIARAVLRNTEILFLDEATSALDVATERKVLRNLMTADKHRICLLTTHRPSVLSLCNRVYKISDRKTRIIGDEEIYKLMNDF